MDGRAQDIVSLLCLLQYTVKMKILEKKHPVKAVQTRTYLKKIKYFLADILLLNASTSLLQLIRMNTKSSLPISFFNSYSGDNVC